MASSLQGSPFLKYIKAGIIKKLCAKNIKCDINTGALKKKMLSPFPVETFLQNDIVTNCSERNMKPCRENAQNCSVTLTRLRR